MLCYQGALTFLVFGEYMEEKDGSMDPVGWFISAAGLWASKKQSKKDDMFHQHMLEKLNKMDQTIEGLKKDIESRLPSNPEKKDVYATTATVLTEAGLLAGDAETMVTDFLVLPSDNEPDEEEQK